MKFHDLKAGSNKSRTRVGRGISAGRGKTAGRGTKGQGSRKSGGVRPGFEGGQMPLTMRLPKLRGKKSFHAAAQNVYTAQLEDLKKVINSQSLFEAGLISDPRAKVKLVVKGSLASVKDVSLPAASRAAIAAIENAGGTFKKVHRSNSKAALKPKTKK